MTTTTSTVTTRIINDYGALVRVWFESDDLQLLNEVTEPLHEVALSDETIFGQHMTTGAHSVELVMMTIDAPIETRGMLGLLRVLEAVDRDLLNEETLGALQYVFNSEDERQGIYDEKPHPISYSAFCLEAMMRNYGELLDELEENLRHPHLSRIENHSH